MSVVKIIKLGTRTNIETNEIIIRIVIRKGKYLATEGLILSQVVFDTMFKVYMVKTFTVRPW